MRPRCPDRDYQSTFVHRSSCLIALRSASAAVIACFKDLVSHSEGEKAWHLTKDAYFAGLPWTAFN